MTSDLLAMARTGGALIIVMSACAVAAQKPPVSWVLRRLVRDPLSEVFDERVEAKVAPMIATALKPITARQDQMERKLDLVLTNQADVKVALEGA